MNVYFRFIFTKKTIIQLGVTKIRFLDATENNQTKQKVSFLKQRSDFIWAKFRIKIFSVFFSKIKIKQCLPGVILAWDYKENEAEQEAEKG